MTQLQKRKHRINITITADTPEDVMRAIKDIYDRFETDGVGVIVGARYNYTVTPHTVEVVDGGDW